MNVHSLPDQPARRHDPDQILIPKPILYMMIALMLFTLVSIALARQFNIGLTREGKLDPVETVQFTVTGSQGGPLVVTRKDGYSVTLAKANQEIFPRLILRSIANVRQRDGVPLSKPLKLEVLPSGQRMLVDKYTNTNMRLDAFGDQNGHVLDPLLAGKADK